MSAFDKVDWAIYDHNAIYDHGVDILNFEIAWIKNSKNGWNCPYECDWYPKWDWLQMVAQGRTLLGYWEWAYQEDQEDRARKGWPLDYRKLGDLNDGN